MQYVFSRHSSLLKCLQTPFKVIKIVKTVFPVNENSCDRDQIRQDFTNGGRGHSPKHLKFFLLVFSKSKEELK